MRLKGLLAGILILCGAQICAADSYNVTFTFDEYGHGFYQWNDTTSNTITQSGALVGTANAFSLGGLSWMQYVLPVPLGSPDLGGVVELQDSGTASDYLAFDGRTPPAPNSTSWNIEFVSAPGSAPADATVAAWNNRSVSPGVVLPEGVPDTDYKPTTTAGNGQNHTTFEWKIVSDGYTVGPDGAISPLPASALAGFALLAALGAGAYWRRFRPAC